MKRLSFFVSAFLVLITLLSGCTNPLYVQKVNAAYTKLQIGMTKSEVEKLFNKTSFIREQVVKLYPDRPEETTRRALKFDKSYEDVHPSNLMDTIGVDGNFRVLEYLEKKVQNWPNGIITYYVAVFYDSRNNKVVGWAKMSTYVPPDDWGDRF